MHSFPRKKRLLNKHDYEKVFSSGKKIATFQLTAFVKKNSHELPRLGVVVSKRQIPRAVDRNKIKRMLRECFRKHDSMPNVDIVVLAYKGLEKLSNPILREKVIELWKKIEEWYEKYCKSS
ncbi:MAG: ribonuclease P protein component [Proteobacteria bacterium]|nr:ribonuclease P protein component [Pseudomonadota bacterium]